MKVPAEHRDYFTLRRPHGEQEADARLPPAAVDFLAGLEPDAAILDIGCGDGSLLRALAEAGFQRARGVDLSAAAVAHCRSRGLDVTRVEALDAWLAERLALGERYDLVVLAHVLEHLPKHQMIATLAAVRTLLSPTVGRMYIAVPNAQSPTGCYWAYEDFTHTTLFTAGSLLYVLAAAGFADIRLLDTDGCAYIAAWKRPIRRALLAVYRARLRFWQRVTASAWHAPSPVVFTYEIKSIAR